MMLLSLERTLPWYFCSCLSLGRSIKKHSACVVMQDCILWFRIHGMLTSSCSVPAGMQAAGPLVEQPLEYFQQVMDTNLTGAVRMTQAIVPAMLARVSTSFFVHHVHVTCA